MPWIRPERAAPKGPNGGEQASQQKIRCDLCSWETQKEYWGPKKAGSEAGVWWPKTEDPQGKDQPVWCPRCASRQSDTASQSYCDKSLDVESVMSEHWREPTGRVVVPGNIVAKAHLGRVPPKAPPPGISSLATQDRLAALEEEVARLRLRVAQLEEHSSGAATGSSS